MPISKAQQRAVAKYEAANYDKFLIRVPKGQKDKIATYAVSIGLSLNAFVLYSINKTMSTDINISTDNDMPINVKCDRCGTLNNGYQNGWFRCSDCESINYEPTEEDIDSDIVSNDTSTDSDMIHCLYCGNKIEGRKSKKFCSSNCRTYHHRKTKGRS